MEKRYLGIEELSQYLGLTKGTLYDWTCQRRIPYLKVGKLLKFNIIGNSSATRSIHAWY